MSAMTSRKPASSICSAICTFPASLPAKPKPLPRPSRRWLEHGGGHNQRPHDDKRNSALLPFIDRHPYLCALLDDERVESIGTTLLGADFNYMSSDGNYMSSDGNYFAGDTAWHSDGYRRAPGLPLDQTGFLSR